MAIQFKCACGRDIEIDESLIGKPMHCRECGAPVKIPSAGATPVVPIPVEVVADGELIPPGAVLGYGTAATFQQRNLHSRDRAMLVRICRIMGLMFCLLGAALALWSCVLLSQMYRPNDAFFIMSLLEVAFIVVPGVLLRFWAGRAATGGNGWVVALLILTILMGLGHLLIAVVLTIGVCLGRLERTEDYIQMGVAILFTVILSQAIYYAIRVLSGRAAMGPTEGSIADIRSTFSVQRLRANGWGICLTTAIFGIIAQMVLALMSLVWVNNPPRALRAPAPAATLPPPSAAALAPYSRDLHGERGLSKPDREAAVAAIARAVPLLPGESELLDDMLRESGRDIFLELSPPLTEADVWHDLQRHASDPPERPAIKGRSLRLPHGVLHFFPKQSSSFIFYRGDVGSDNYSINAGYRSGGGTQRRRTLGSVERCVKSMIDHLGEPITTAQGDVVTDMITPLAPTAMPNMSRLPDNSIELSFGGWSHRISPAGIVDEPVFHPVEDQSLLDAERSVLRAPWWMLTISRICSATVCIAAVMLMIFWRRETGRAKAAMAMLTASLAALIAWSVLFAQCAKINANKHYEVVENLGRLQTTGIVLLAILSLFGTLCLWAARTAPKSPAAVPEAATL